MCLTPVQLKKESLQQQIMDSYKMQQVPCGTCLECRKQRVNSWFVRLKSHMKDVKSAYFVTLTYDDDTLPISDDWIPTLNYKDFQKFVKNLRYTTDNKISYFCVGEYGSKTQRPHYHAIIFNAKDTDIVNTWKLGFAHIGTVTDKSLYYTLKYTLKRTFDDKKRTDRLPEKALMSKGIGINFLTPQMVKHYNDDVSRPITF